jgi:hypothetical protein
MNFDIVDIAGFMGMTSFVLAYQARSVRGTNMWFIPGDFSYSLHFLLLGAPGLAAMTFLAGIRDILMTSTQRKLLCYTAYFYPPLVWLLTWLTAEQAFEFLGCVASTLCVVAMSLHGHFMTSRFVLLVHQFVWVSAAILSGSWPLLLHNCLTITSSLITMLRHFRAMQPGYDSTS